MQTTWRPVDPGKTRSHLPDDAFAFPRERKEPLTDGAHVRGAIARFRQVDEVSDRERALAFDNIKAAAAYYGVHVSANNWHDLMG
jgi:hypothetical protein